jgi:hypothetical protein
MLMYQYPRSISIPYIPRTVRTVLVLHYLHQKRISSTPNDPCGDSFDIAPAPDRLRIWSNNINTLSLSHGLAEFRELCD